MIHLEQNLIYVNPPGFPPPEQDYKFRLFTKHLTSFCQFISL